MQNLHKTSFEQIKQILKTKKMLFAHWDCENQQDASYQQWGIALKNLFPNIIFFSPKKNYFNEGKQEMNKRFLQVVKDQKPDYIFMLLLQDEFSIESLKMIKTLSPHSTTINLSGDDDWRFDDFARYYALFFDYNISAHYHMPPRYKKDGINNVFFACGVNTHHYRPLNLPLKYDVSFIGRASDQRAQLIQPLKEHGVRVHLFGHGWSSYPEFKEEYHSPLNAEDFVKVINQTKINLCFTKGGFGTPQFKGRALEIASCQSFSLVEYFSGYFHFFKENELVMFKNEKDFVTLIDYYLSHEKERKKIAIKSYNKVTKYYNQEQEILGFFKTTLAFKPRNKPPVLPMLNKKIVSLSINDLISGKFHNKIQNADYITFSESGVNIYPDKEYLQAYALQKSKKPTSCCDYYVNNRLLGNYLLFRAKHAYEKLSTEDFHELVQLSQLMMEKKYFLKNRESLLSFIEGGKNIILNKENTVFISIPLLEISQIRSLEYEKIKEAFSFKFLDTLYSVKYQWILNCLYPLKLLATSAKQPFILQSLIHAIRDKGKLAKLRKGF